MEFWIDIEDASGNKVGDGPIITALFWERTRRLDRIGSIRFAVPAADTRAHTLLSELVRVHAWARDNGQLYDGGIGIVEKISRATDAEGKIILEVEGSDLLLELSWRHIFSLGIYADTTVTPTAVKFFDGGVYTNLANTIDGNPVTYNAITLQELESYLYIAAAATFNKIDISLSQVNTITADGKWGFSDERPASLIPPLGGWREPDVEDGTVSSGVPLALTGTVEFTRPGDWKERTIDSVTGYWVRLDPTETLDEVRINEIELTQREATTDDLSLVMGYPKGDNIAPYENDPDPDSGWLWELDLVNGYGGTVLGTYFFLVDETVLSALGKIGERTGEHFRLGVGRLVVWIGADVVSSGAIATSDVDPIAIESNPDLLLITDLQEEIDAGRLVTRIVPYGAGNETARITLSDVSAAAEADLPSGYVLDREANYIKNTAAETAYGRIVAVEDFKEVRGEGSAARDQAASDELFYEALYWLQRHVEPYKSYRLTVTAVRQAVEVGETVKVDYQRVVDGEAVWTVNDTLHVLEVTDRWDENGMRTAALQVASTDRYPETDNDYINRQLEQSRVYQRHGQGVASRNVR